MLILSGALLQADQTQPDPAAFLRIFDGIGQQIDEYLIQPRLISNQTFVPDSRYDDIKFLTSRFCHGPYNRIYRRNHIVQRKLTDRQHHFTALDLGNIQHIVNQTEQMTAGRRNFFRIFLYFIRIFRIPGQ